MCFGICIHASSSHIRYKQILCPLISCLCSGFLRARQQVYLIEPLGQSEDGEHAVYRPEQMKVGSQPGCGATSNTTSNATSRLFDREEAPRPAALLGSRSQVSATS